MQDYKTYPVYQWLLEQTACPDGMAWVDTIKPKTHKALWLALLKHNNKEWLSWYLARIWTAALYELLPAIKACECPCKYCSTDRLITTRTSAWLRANIEISED